MKRKGRTAAVLTAAAVAAAAVFLSGVLPRLVPDYRNTIRTVDYERGSFISAAAEEELRLYPWTELREEDCVTLAELEADDEEAAEAARGYTFQLMDSLVISGFLKDYAGDSIRKELEQNALFDPEAVRMYVRKLTVITWEGESSLSFAAGPAGLEYLKVSLPEEKELTMEESAGIRSMLQELRISFRMDFYGYDQADDGEYDGNLAGTDGGGTGMYEGKKEQEDAVGETELSADGEAAVPADVFETFYQEMWVLEEGLQQGVTWMLTEAFSSFSCDIISYQGEFLLVFSGEEADAEMILIYSPAARRISGFSLRF